MTKKKKNEMPVYGVTCSKCGGSDIVMNTDTKGFICLDCGEGANPCLILNIENPDDVKYPTITVTDESKTFSGGYRPQKTSDDSIPPVPTTGSDAYKAPTELNVKVSRNEDNIDILDENTKRLFDMITKLEAKVDKLATSSEDDIETLRQDLGDLSVKTKDAVLKAFKKIDDLTYKVNAMNCESDTDHITTFGDLKVGDKFKLSNDTTPYIKVRNVGDCYLAYNAKNFFCYAIRDNCPVIPIKDGADVHL